MLAYFKQTSIQIILFTVAFFALALAKPGEGYSDFLFMFSAAAAVIFSIFIVFSVSNSRSRLDKVNELLKTENANNLLLYKMSAAFGVQAQNDIRRLIDVYIIDQIDYRLEDFDQSAQSFRVLYDYIISLESKGTTQDIVLTEMIRILNLSSSNRVQVETLMSQRLSKFEWISVWGLTFVVVSHLYEMSHGILFQTLLLTILASASVLLVLVLRDLDNLKWQKDAWTWRPLRNLFISLDLLPYYPRPIVDKGEAKIKKGEKIRLADYPNLYPDMRDKIVKTEEYKGVKKLKR